MILSNRRCKVTFLPGSAATVAFSQSRNASSLHFPIAEQYHTPDVASNHHRLLVLPKHPAQGVGNLTHSCISLNSLENSGHQVLFGACGLLPIAHGPCEDPGAPDGILFIPIILDLIAFLGQQGTEPVQGTIKESRDGLVHEFSFR